MQQGDLIIDGGNSFFADTERRVKELEKRLAIHRDGCIRRRKRRAVGSQHDAGRFKGSLAARSGHV